MKRFFLLFLVCFTLLLGSCNNPLSRTYNHVTCEQDMQDIRASNNVSDDDIILLAKSMAVAKLSGNVTEGQTYEDMLDNIKKIQKAGSDELENQKNNEQVKRDRMYPLLNVALLEKKFSRIGNKDCLTYVVSFQNTSPENIKTIVGNIRLNDLLEKQIKQINILLDEEVKPNSTLKKIFVFAYNHGDDNDQRIRSKDLIDLRIEWNPEKIIFESGKLAE